MPFTEADKNFLAQALQQAELAIHLSDPNPRVGCVLVNATGTVIGQGHTQKVGGPHAEVMALREANSRGHSTQGCCAYVTLEPCSHHGRTGPCCDALVQAGVARVVATMADPNPLVAGQGFARLQQAGAEVLVLPADDPLAQQSKRLNIGFFSRMVRKSPWVRLKVATSLDGKTALPDGQSQWITGPAARADGHAWRARASAVLTGIGTVLHDRPRLDVRLIDTPRQPDLMIVDSQLRTPPDSALFEARRRVVIYCAEAHAEGSAARSAALRARGAEVVCLPATGRGTAARQVNPQVDLQAMLQDMARREVNELHVEAGQTLNGALLTAGLVDEVLLYLAPKLLGKGRDLALWGPLASLQQAAELDFDGVEHLGPDLRICATVKGRAAF